MQPMFKIAKIATEACSPKTIEPLILCPLALYLASDALFCFTVEDVIFTHTQSFVNEFSFSMPKSLFLSKSLCSFGFVFSRLKVP